MKIETIEELRNTGIITLVECNESEKTNNKDVVKDIKKGKWYKIEETNEEIKLELLLRIFKCISTIKSIMVGFTAMVVIYVFLILLNFMVA